MPALRFGSSPFAAISAIALAFILAAVVQPRASFAYTPEQQQACTPDAMRLCGEFVPNVDAITACMIQKKAQLSPQCRVFFRSGPEPGEAAAPPPGRPVNLKPRKTTTKPAAAKKTTASKKPKKPRPDEG
jgi:hypothetical protein